MIDWVCRVGWALGPYYRGDSYDRYDRFLCRVGWYLGPYYRRDSYDSYDWLGM
jgi:hypothetical protein